MKRLFLIFVLALSAVGLAQTTVTDNFPGTGGAALNGNWTNSSVGGYVPCGQFGGNAQPNTSNSQCIESYTGASFTNNQYAQFVVNGSFSSNATSPGVRFDTAGNGYVFSPTFGLYKLAAGVGTVKLANCAAASSGDLLLVSAVGSTITGMDVTTGNNCSATDTSYPTGQPAVYLDNRGSSNDITLFQAGTFVGFTATPSVLIVSSTGNSVTLSGTNTPWTSGTPGSPTFTVSGTSSCSKTAQTVASSTSATLTINAGATLGTCVITDPSTSTTFTLQVAVNPIAQHWTLDCHAGCTGLQTAPPPSTTTPGDLIIPFWSADEPLVQFLKFGPDSWFNAANFTWSANPPVLYFGAMYSSYVGAISSSGSYPQINYPVTWHGTINFVEVRGVNMYDQAAVLGTNTGVQSSITTSITAANPPDVILGAVFGIPNSPTITGSLGANIVPWNANSQMSVDANYRATGGSYSYGATYSSTSSNPGVVLGGYFLTSATNFAVVPAVFSPGPSNYISPVSVTLTPSTQNSQAFYTTDGSTPSCSSTPYTGPISVTSTLNLKYVTCSSVGQTPSFEIDGVWTITGGTQTDWYIRPDGGTGPIIGATPGQCDGKHNAAYPGTGTNQPCAFNDYRYLYDQQGTLNWIINGGDTVHVNGCTTGTNNPISGQCQIGWQAAPGSGGGTVWCQVVGFSCANPTIPSGAVLGTVTNIVVNSGVATITASNSLSAGNVVMVGGLTAGAELNAQPLTVLSSGLSSSQFEATSALSSLYWANISSTADSGVLVRPTRILGSNAGSCNTGTLPNHSSLAYMWGAFTAGAVVNLDGAQYVDVECLELTSHSSCNFFGALSWPGYCDHTTGNYTSQGMTTDWMMSNVYLQDMYIHGHTARGIKGSIGGTITCFRCQLYVNGATGWDFDDGLTLYDGGFGTPPINGLWKFFYSEIEWSGCVQDWPTYTTAFTCYAQSSGGQGDAVGTTAGGNISANLDHVKLEYSAQDGLDVGHGDVGCSGAGYVDQSGCSLSVTNSYSLGNLGAGFKWGPNYLNPIFAGNVMIDNYRRMAYPISGLGLPPDVTITGWSSTDGVTISFTTLTQSLVAGTPLMLSGFTTTTAFNGQGFQDVSQTGLSVLSSGLTSTSFQVSRSGIVGAGTSGTESGTATQWNGTLTDWGRSGAAVSMNWHNNSGTGTIANNTIVSYFGDMFTPACWEGGYFCKQATFNLYNNIIAGTQSNLPPAVNDYNTDSGGVNGIDWKFGAPPVEIGTFNQSNNNWWGVRSENCTFFANEVCTNPNFFNSSGVVWCLTFTGCTPNFVETQFDVFNLTNANPAFNLTAGSPAIGAGTTYTGLPAFDFNGLPMPSPPMMGAVAFQGAAPNTTIFFPLTIHGLTAH